MIRQKTINLFCQIWKYSLTSKRFNQEPRVYELWLNWVWSQWKSEHGHLYLQVLSRWTNVEGANRIAITILVHVTFLYPRRWENINSTFKCASIKRLLPRSSIQYPTGLNITQKYHRREFPVIHYHEIMLIYYYPFLVVITQLLSWIIFVNIRICILTGPHGYIFFVIVYVKWKIGGNKNSPILSTLW